LFHDAERVGLFKSRIDRGGDDINAPRSDNQKRRLAPGMPTRIAHFIQPFKVARAQREDKDSVELAQILWSQSVGGTSGRSEQNPLAARNGQRARVLG